MGYRIADYSDALLNFTVWLGRRGRRALSVRNDASGNMRCGLSCDERRDRGSSASATA